MILYIGGASDIDETLVSDASTPTVTSPDAAAAEATSDGGQGLDWPASLAAAEATSDGGQGLDWPASLAAAEATSGGGTDWEVTRTDSVEAVETTGM